MGRKIGHDSAAMEYVLVAKVRAALGGAPFLAAWADGRAMRIEHAVAYALTPEQCD